MTACASVRALSRRKRRRSFAAWSLREPAGAQLAAGCAQALRQFPFEEGMHVFIVERRADLARQELRFQPVHFAQQLLQFVSRQDFGASKLLRMRA